MIRPQKAAAALAVLFLAALFCGGVFNLSRVGTNLANDLAAVSAPHSLDGVRNAAARVNAIVDKNLLGKEKAWAAYAWIQNALGKSSMNNFSVIKAPDGRLYRGGLFPIRIGEADVLAKDIITFAEAAMEKGTTILYLGTPDTVLLDAQRLPEGMPYVDYNVAIDSFLYALRERDVPFLDTRYAFLSHGFPSDAISPKTAFLLSGHAGFAAFSYLVEGLERRFGFVLDRDGFYRDPANYDFERRADFFIGQLGKETGPAFSGVDEFTAVTPRFETDFAMDAVGMFGEASSREGPATETILHPDALVFYNSLYNLYPEGYYMHANTAWSKVVNRRNPGGPKALIIHDFYTAQVISHLAPLFSEMHTLAYYESHPLNALEYIADEDFDLILISFFPQNLLSPDSQALIGVEE